MGYIYMLTNKVNGKRYIGQTIQNDISGRWNAYKKLQKNCIGAYLFNALTKWGPQNFKFQIVCVCFDSDCDSYEISYIKKFNSLAPSGYNLQQGGTKYKHHHPETIQKMRETLCRMRQTDEYRTFMSKKMKGANHPCFGKKLSDEHKRKLSTVAKSRTEDHKQKLSAARKKAYEAGKMTGLNYSCSLKKRVKQHDLQNNFIRTFDSISSAAHSVEGNNTMITKCAKNPDATKSYKGFIWKFETSEVSEEPKKKTKSSREYKSFLRNPDGSVATLC